MSKPRDTDAIGLCLAGRISPAVALARLLLGGATPAKLAEAVAHRRPAGDDPARTAWTALATMLDRRRDAMTALSEEIAATGSNHAALGGAEKAVADIAAFFDRAVAFSPEASVALYSLGDPAILADSTAETLRWLTAQGWLHGGSDVLDFGCGIGRLAVAMAPRCRSILGLDVSAGMLAEARRRCAGWPGVRLATATGHGLADWPDSVFDLVLAADSFPYVVQAGPAAVQRHIADMARVLRPGGHLVILNLSYGRDAAADAADVAEWCGRHDMDAVVVGARPFTLWDASAFVLQASLERI